VGPSDEVYDSLMAFEVQRFQAEHPQVIIKKPNEVPSHLWEVYVGPKSSCIAFDNPRTMLIALSMISPEADDEEATP
jgi:hypothetical protein